MTDEEMVMEICIRCGHYDIAALCNCDLGYAAPSDCPIATKQTRKPKKAPANKMMTEARENKG